jgi:hypothetical protein
MIVMKKKQPNITKKEEMNEWRGMFVRLTSVVSINKILTQKTLWLP